MLISFFPWKLDSTLLALNNTHWTLLEMWFYVTSHHLFSAWKWAYHDLAFFQMLQSLFIFEAVLRGLALVCLAPFFMVWALKSLFHEGLLSKSVHLFELGVLASHGTVSHSTLLHVLDTIWAKESLALLAFLWIKDYLETNCTREIRILLLCIVRILGYILGVIHHPWRELQYLLPFILWINLLLEILGKFFCKFLENAWRSIFHL